MSVMLPMLPATRRLVDAQLERMLDPNPAEGAELVALAGPGDEIFTGGRWRTVSKVQVKGRTHRYITFADGSVVVSANTAMRPVRRCPGAES